MNLKEFKAWFKGYKTALSLRKIPLEKRDFDLIDRKIADIKEEETQSFSASVPFSSVPSSWDSEAAKLLKPMSSITITNGTQSDVPPIDFT